ncbi:MAG: UTP--glucose-1-phosphate uridylyltransferase GalU [Methanobrevibacter sp.]|jgi:UTP--glucose-1-phosphate uridylyltransferase|nr:UTP--glucose-1-phosphate uridylyltransferase GalU [Candidatus Methanovirga aequatorialis]
MKCVIPAAGLGTRFLPITKAQPKEMLPVYDRPTIQYVIEEAVASGIDDILIVTGKGKRSIEDHFDRSFELEVSLKEAGKFDLLKTVERISDLANVYYIRQKKQKGLGDAIYCAKKHVGDEPFAVMLGDIITKADVPCTKQLIDLSEKYDSSAIAVEMVPNEKVERYGIIDGTKTSKNVYKINALVEKPKINEAPSNLAIMGRYVLYPELFDHIEDTELGVGGEIQLTDAMDKLNTIYANVFNGRSYDIGNKIDWLKTSIEFALSDEEYKDVLLDHIHELIK